MNKLQKMLLKNISKYTARGDERWKVNLPDGRGNKIRYQGFLTQQDALKFAELEWDKINKGENHFVSSLGGSIAFNDFTQSWLKEKLNFGLQESSRQRYEDVIRLIIDPYFHGKTLKDVNKYLIRNFVPTLIESGKSNSNIGYACMLLKQIIKKAEDEDLLMIGLHSAIKSPKHKCRDPRFWDSTHVTFFLNAIKDHSKYNLFKFALYTGMRAGEIAGLKWECVKCEGRMGEHKGSIEIKRMYDQKIRRIKETTKNGEKRTIPLFDEAYDVLENQRKLTGELEFVFGGSEPLDASHFNRELQTSLYCSPITR